jgi:outer membrane protein assembly factor BamB
MIRILVMSVVFFGTSYTRAMTETITSADYYASHPPIVEAVVPLPDGEIVVGGKHKSVDENWEIPWIARRDRQGKVLWEKSFSLSETTGYGFFHTVLIVADGDIIAAGGTAGGGSATPAIVVRLDKQGNVRWDSKLPDVPSISTMVPLLDGVIVAGSPRYVPATRSRWVARLDAAGKVMWQKTFNEASGSIYAMTLVGSDGDVIVAGDRDHDCACEGFQPSEPWAARLNGKGDILWQKDLGAGSTDTEKDSHTSFIYFRATSLKAVSANEFALIGKTSEFKAGAEQETGGWQIRLDGEGSVNLRELYGK